MLPEQLLKNLFITAVNAASPQHRMQQYLPSPPQGQTIVVGGGKSASLMAHYLEKCWPTQLSGLVVTRYGHKVETNQIKVVEASHPLPDSQGVEATTEMMQMLSNLQPEDLVICLISGGGSALLTLPPLQLSLDELISIHQQLLASGASIDEINMVRKQLSLTSGGRLAAAAYPATVVSLIISDVPGDNLQVIASGPTVGDTVTSRDALEVIYSYHIEISSSLKQYLENNPYPVIKPGDKRLGKTENILIATPQESLEAAAMLARKHGYQTLILGDSLQGEAKEVGKLMAGIAQQVKRHHQPIPPNCVILSGGETTVTLTGKGKGGPNSEFLLSLAIALQGLEGVYGISCDTDGIDGSESNAGALITPSTLATASSLGLNPRDYLRDHDSYSFFASLDSLVVTGPTLTNVNDFRAILIVS